MLPCLTGRGWGFLLLLTTPALAQQPIPALIPAPQTVEVRPGAFTIGPQTRLAILTPVAEVRRMVTDNLPGIPLIDASNQ